MKPVKKIQKLLDNIILDNPASQREFYINSIHNEFLLFDGKVEIPKISVKELNYKNSIPIIQNLIQYIPDFLKDHILLKEKNPPSEQHYLHFIKRLNGKLINFIHIFKIDFKFGGNPENIIEKGDPDHYPSYYTDRFYYKSRLIPELKSDQTKNNDYFKPIKILDKKKVEADGLFFTSAIFDEMNEKDITMDFCKSIGPKNLNKSYELFPFIVFDYFTACINVLAPTENEIHKAVNIFEPLFLFLYSKYKNIEELINIDILKKEFSEDLIIINNITLKNNFEKKLSNYFDRYILKRNDDLSLKGWWKFEENK